MKSKKRSNESLPLKVSNSNSNNKFSLFSWWFSVYLLKKLSAGPNKIFIFVKSSSVRYKQIPWKNKNLQFH